MAYWRYFMAAVSVRNLDEFVKDRLRVRAAAHGRSMEAEIRTILVEAVTDAHERAGLFDTLMARVGELGEIELDLPARATTARAADLHP